MREDGEQSFVKAQCMHCVDPACASACMLGALKKREFGIVTYNPDLCVGCRYCEVACPFNVPKFEWSSAAPKIVKCELCKERLAAGKEPACTEVCPRHAVIFGKRTDLLDEAHRRLARQARVATFRRCTAKPTAAARRCSTSRTSRSRSSGFPALGDEPAPQLARSIQHGVYRGFIAPLALYAALGAVMLRNREHGEAGGDHDRAR